MYGQAKDAAGEAIHAVGKMPASLEDTIRHYIQNRPYTTAAIALGLGRLIGRSHTVPSSAGEQHLADRVRGSKRLPECGVTRHACAEDVILPAAYRQNGLAFAKRA